MKYSTQNFTVFGGILLGFLLYGLKSFAQILFHPLQALFAVIGLSLIFFTPFYFRFKAIIPLQGIIRIVFYFYLAWILVIILRPFFEGQNYSVEALHPYSTTGLTSYLLPFLVLLGAEIISLPKLFKISYIFALIGFAYFILNFNNMQAIVSEGIIGGNEDTMGINGLANEYFFWFNISSLSLLCYEFISKKLKWTAILASVLMLFLMIYFARRGAIFMFLMYFLGAFYLYILQPDKNTKFFKVLFTLLIIATVVSTVLMYANTTFSLLFTRMDEDTRSGVNESVIRYLNNENAWFLGKGSEGAYPDINWDKPRYGVETGYLNMILKGGIVYLSLYCFLLLHSAYLGFFKTNNRLTKAFALYIFFHVLFLVPYGVISFGLEYLFVWVGVVVCQSNKYRLMTNQQLKFYLVKTQ